MCRFHTIEKITDYGVNQVLFKRGNKILAFAEDRFGKWLYWFGKPSKKPNIGYWQNSYEDVEKDILNVLQKRKEV